MAQGAGVALSNLKNAINEIWGLASKFDNEDIEEKDICTINIKIDTLESRSSELGIYKYYIAGILQLPLITPCMKPKGFLIDSYNFYCVKYKYNGLTISLKEEYANNTATINFYYESEKIDICQNIENIEEVEITTTTNYD